MQQHPLIGTQIIGEHDDGLLSAARLIALTQHEKWDGSSHPQGLSGEQMPLIGRIVALADECGALTDLRLG